MENPRLIVFDVDGTLLPGTSCERLFFKHLAKKKILGLGNLFKFTIRGIALVPKGKAYIISANKGYLKGFPAEYMENIAKDFFNSHIANRVSKKGIIELNEHKDNGDKVVLLSGMPEFLLKNFAESLNVGEYYGSVMEIKDNRFTGKTVGVFPIARGKVVAVEKIMNKYRLDWRHVTVYADHYHDRFLLRKAGKPVAVNPNERLKEIAVSNSWDIEYFD
jgi:HAD superfamily hydrolase (TIGR01490 family)